jgi:hypothetical protein
MTDLTLLAGRTSRNHNDFGCWGGAGMMSPHGYGDGGLTSGSGFDDVSHDGTYWTNSCGNGHGNGYVEQFGYADDLFFGLIGQRVRSFRSYEEDGGCGSGDNYGDRRGNGKGQS